MPDNEAKVWCHWCTRYEKPLKKHQLDWSVIDDDFGQFVPIEMVKYCFCCGRKLEE